MSTAFATTGTDLATDSHGYVETDKYVSFWVENQLLGVPVNTVQEVLTPQSIAPIPKAKSEIAGLLNLRGQIVTAVDLRCRLGLPEHKIEDMYNVVIRTSEEAFSLLVDEVGDVIDVNASELQPTPRTLDARWSNVTEGVFRLESRLFVILDVDVILDF